VEFVLLTEGPEYARTEVMDMLDLRGNAQAKVSVEQI
jgi:hypothetical protein